MPAVIDTFTCNRHAGCALTCAPKRVCPQKTIHLDRVRQEISVNSDLCGRCSGPCMRACSWNAVHYTLNEHAFRELKSRIKPEAI